MSNTVRPEEFGKDLGLLHEVVVTGRKVGANHEFWARIAHDEKKFREVVKLVFAEDWFPFTTTTVSLGELRERNPTFFHAKSDCWWLSKPFACKRGKAGRLYLWPLAFPHSFNKSWREQQQLLSDGEFVPTVRDLFEGIIAYHQATGKSFLSPGYWVRTQDVSWIGSRMVVEALSTTFGVASGRDDERNRRIGLAVVRKSI